MNENRRLLKFFLVALSALVVGDHARWVSVGQNMGVYNYGVSRHDESPKVPETDL